MQSLKISSVVGCDNAMLSTIASLTGLTSLIISGCRSDTDVQPEHNALGMEDCGVAAPALEVHPRRIKALEQLFESITGIGPA